MVESVGNIAVKLSADTAAFDRGMERASRNVRGFERSGQRMGRTLARVAAGAATAVAGMAAGTVTLARNAARSAVEIENLSRAAGAAPAEFQRWAAATETVGIEQSKLAGILRDTQDRIGDFLTTGGGPMADFFETVAPQIGVTVDEFARLSGPQALQLYVDSLERANLNQAQMTFFLEGLASDASDLLPLLRNNGRALDELGDAAERSGRLMSQEAIAAGRELDDTLRTVTSTIRDSLNAALLENSDEIMTLAENIDGLLEPALSGVVDVAVQVTGALTEIASGIADIIDGIGELAGAGLEAVERLGQDGVQSSSIDSDSRLGRWELNRGNPAWLGLDSGYANAAGDAGFSAPSITPSLIPSTRPSMRPQIDPNNGTFGGGRNNGGGGGSSFSRDDFETLQERFMTEQELLQANYDRQLEQLREYREAGLGTQAEFNELERRITQEHQDSLKGLEQQAARERLELTAGMMGNAASILESGGRKNLEIVRNLRVAEATINGVQAAVSAWRDGMEKGGPLAAAFQASASLARTTTMINQMKGVSAGGGGGGGASISGGGQASAATSRHVAIQMVGGDTFTSAQVRDLINRLNEEIEDGAQLRIV